MSLEGSVQLQNARLGDRLIRPGIPLLVGGNNTALLRYAAEYADIIGLTGLGRTLAGGHRHEVRWDEAELQRTFSLARSSPARTTQPQIQVLVQWAEVTDDPQGVADRISHDLEVPPAQVLTSPFILLGTITQITDQVLANSDRWGIDSYVVRESSIDDIGHVIAALDRL